MIAVHIVFLHPAAVVFGACRHPLTQIERCVLEGVVERLIRLPRDLQAKPVVSAAVITPITTLPADQLAVSPVRLNFLRYI
jgi:hypothetical protein